MPAPDVPAPRFSAYRDPAAPETAADPVAVAALISGVVGIVVFGLLFAVVTAVLGAVAGQRATEAGRSLRLPYYALGLALVDAVVWLALQKVFDLPTYVG